MGFHTDEMQGHSFLVMLFGTLPKYANNALLLPNLVSQVIQRQERHWKAAYVHGDFSDDGGQ